MPKILVDIKHKCFILEVHQQRWGTRPLLAVLRECYIISLQALAQHKQKAYMLSPRPKNFLKF